MFNGVIIKLSGEELGATDSNFDDAFINDLTDDIIRLRAQHKTVALVVGGGNFWRGRDARAEMDKTRADNIGMLATIMNGIYLSDAFAVKGVSARVLTPFAVGGMTELYSGELAARLLADGDIPIFSGGTGLPFFSTDMIAAVRGAQLGMDAILYAKPVDGIYDKDPNKFDDAVKLPRITYDYVIEHNRDIKAIDTAAACMMRDQGLVCVIFKVSLKHALITAACGTEDDILKIGTIIR